MKGKLILQTVMLLAVLLFALNAWAISSRAYVTDLSDGTVSVIDTGSNTVVATIPVGGIKVAVNSAGNRVYVQDGHIVSVLDTSTNTVVASIPVEGSNFRGR